MNIKQSDFHSNPFRCLRHTPSRNSPLLRVIFSRPELRPLVIIIPMSHRFVKHFIIHMFHTSVMPYISLDQYLNPNLYIIPNMQNVRIFCCSVYILKLLVRYVTDNKLILSPFSLDIHDDSKTNTSHFVSRSFRGSAVAQ